MKHALLVVIALGASTPRSTRADDVATTPAPAPASPDSSSLSKLKYLVDGGALPFFWGALGGTVLLNHYLTPPETPRWFSANEGGAASSSWELPGSVVTGIGAGVLLGMIAGGEDSRWYHAKGLAESLATGGLVTTGLKNLVGRHRPDWASTNDGVDERRSFPSGHTFQAFSIATYSVLYLHQHVFPSRPAWQEGLAIGGIALGATAIAAERVLHDRHNLSDVVVGGLLGTATSTLFYLYQEHRYQDHKAFERSIQLAPSVTGTSIGLSLSGSF